MSRATFSIAQLCGDKESELLSEGSPFCVTFNSTGSVYFHTTQNPYENLGCRIRRERERFLR